MRKLIQFVNALSRFYQNVKRSGITSISQRRQGAKDQVEMITMHCFYYISIMHCTSSGIFSAPALSKSSTDARAALRGILHAGAKNLAGQIGSKIPRSALISPRLASAILHRQYANLYFWRIRLILSAKPLEDELVTLNLKQSVWTRDIQSLVVADTVNSNSELDELVQNGLPMKIVNRADDLIRFMIDGGVLPRKTIEDAKKSKSGALSPANSERVIRVLRMVQQTINALGEERAIGWLQKPNKQFGGSSAIQMAKTESGARAVEQFLLQLSHGFAA